MLATVAMYSKAEVVWNALVMFNTAAEPVTLKVIFTVLMQQFTLLIRYSKDDLTLSDVLPSDGAVEKSRRLHLRASQHGNIDN